MPWFLIAVADLGGGLRRQPQGNLTHLSTGSAIQGECGRTWGVEALLIPSQLAALPVRSTGTTTNVDMVTGNDDYLVFQVRTGDDETNQYWIVGPDGLKARLAAESTSTPQAGDELLDRWRDFLPVENDFVLARGNNAPIIIDLQTQKWAAVPEAYDAWSGYLSFVDVETEDYWEWQSPVPTSELSRLQGCASQPPEYSWDW